MDEYHGASGHVFYQRRPFRRWALLLATALILALLLGYTRWLNAPPNIVIPAHPTILHNAFDEYLRAARLIKDKSEIDAAVGPDSSPSAARADALIRENEPALRALRLGLGEQYMEPATRSFTAPMPYLPRDRSVARLLRLDGQQKAIHGDWNGMVSDDLDLVRFGLQIPRGGTLISMLVGEAVEGIGIAEMERALPHVDARTSRDAAKRLEALDARRQPMSTTLREEKWSTEAGLLDAFRRPAWRWQFATTLLPNDGDYTNYLMSLRLMRYSERQIFGNFNRYMDQAIANSELPYGTVQPVLPVPDDPIGQILTPVFNQANFHVFREKNREALLITALALHAYRLENGAYPVELNALERPGYLRRLPADPFAPDGKLRYRLMGKNYLLYSVGPDRIDDNGVPFENGAEPVGHVSHAVLPDSRGDIVFGSVR